MNRVNCEGHEELDNMLLEGSLADLLGQLAGVHRLKARMEIDRDNSAEDRAAWMLVERHITEAIGTLRLAIDDRLQGLALPLRRGTQNPEDPDRITLSIASRGPTVNPTHLLHIRDDEARNMRMGTTSPPHKLEVTEAADECIQQAINESMEEFEKKHPEVLESHPMQPCSWIRHPTAGDLRVEDLTSDKLTEATVRFGTQSGPGYPVEHLEVKLGRGQVQVDAQQVPEAPKGGDSPIHTAFVEASRDALRHMGSELMDECYELFIRKHNDYGPGNNAIWQEQGVLVKITDKLMRLMRHYFDGIELKTDTVEDSWKDIVNHALIGLVIERGLWPKWTLLDMSVDMKQRHIRTDWLCPICQDPSVHIWQVDDCGDCLPKFTLQCAACDSRYRVQCDTRLAPTLGEQIGKELLDAAMRMRHKDS